MNQKPVINAESKQLKTPPIQLEPIKLPRFAGSIVEWQHYYHIFLELIHVRADPVSYTHLDVYKRQVYPSDLL